MKPTSIFFILLFLSFFTYSQEYQYVPFPDSNAVWSEVYWKPISDPCPGWVYNKYALFNEDTVINDITYQKLFHTNDSEITRENSTCIGGIREDSFKRVFVNKFSKTEAEAVLSNENGEILLNDFSVEIGDTLFEEKDHIIIQPYSYIVVADIDTIKYKNSLRKVFSFKPIPWVYWIEGIGNVKGLLFTSGDLPTNGMDNDLVCFHQNDTLIYYYSGNENVYYDGCVPSFVLNDVALLPNPDVKVYPNPAKGEFVYFEGLDFEKLELYDSNSHLVLSKDINGLDKYVFAISAITPGIYFYQLKKQGLLLTSGKLIIP